MNQPNDEEVRGDYEESARLEMTVKSRWLVTPVAQALGTQP